MSQALQPHKLRLYELFLARLRADWKEVYAAEFSDGDPTPHFTDSRFHRAVFADARRALKYVQGVRPPSADTIGRVLTRRGFAPNAQERTLTGFAYYLTGEDFDAFVQNPPAVPREDMAEVVLPEVSVTQREVPTTVLDNRYRRRWAIPGLVLFLLAGWLVYERGQSLPEPMAATLKDSGEQILAETTVFDSLMEAKRVIATIRASNEAQFEAYRTVDCGVDPVPLAEYYLGAELDDLVGLLEKMHAKQVRLEEGRSSFGYLESQTKIVELSPTMARVETTEKWILRWWYPDTLDREYSVLNDHAYTLEYQADTDRWLIADDEYDGGSHTLEVDISPPPPPCGE